MSRRPATGPERAPEVSETPRKRGPGRPRKEPPAPRDRPPPLGADWITWERWQDLAAAGHLQGGAVLAWDDVIVWIPPGEENPQHAIHVSEIARGLARAVGARAR